MYEVEVKAKLRNRVKVIKKLKSLGCEFSEKLHQVDHIFLPKGTSFPPPFEVPVLRVRKQNDIYLFTLKISQTSRQDCLEREIEIKDGEKMIEILNHIGYEEIVIVEKKRIKTNLNDVEIVLDNVKGLGYFIEAEKIVTHSDSEHRKNIPEELFDLLGTLGISKEDRITVDAKYDIMMHNKFRSK